MPNEQEDRMEFDPDLNWKIVNDNGFNSHIGPLKYARTDDRWFGAIELAAPTKRVGAVGGPKPVTHVVGRAVIAVRQTIAAIQRHHVHAGGIEAQPGSAIQALVIIKENLAPAGAVKALHQASGWNQVSWKAWWRAFT